jgi:predicted MFS family arabinose efflux permease
MATKVAVPTLIGLALILVFVWHALRRDHPLIDLFLFRNRNLTISVITMTLFTVAFMGSMLLIPSYFLQVRGASTLGAGLLLIPQGVGAMITMPAAGALTDRIGPGKLVLGGIVLISIGMGGFTQLAADSSWVFVLGALFLSGLGMGLTMMPIMSAALASLHDQQIARGSTMMNIVQQVAGSIGTAVMSVVLTNQVLGNDAAKAYSAVTQGLLAPGKVPAAVLSQGRIELGHAFGHTYIVALVLTALCIVPAFLLPRQRIEAAKAPVVTGH